MEVTATQQTVTTRQAQQLVRVVFFLVIAAMSCRSDESVSAGGKWVRVQTKDPGTSTDVVSFVLTGETSDLERHPAVSITCSSSPNKPPTVIYNTDARLAATIHDNLNYYSPAMWGWVKVGHERVYKAVWDLIHIPEKPSQSAVVDRKTAKHLLSGAIIRVLFRDYMDEAHTDEFDTQGLNVNDVRESCGDKWFGKDTVTAGTKEFSSGKTE